MYFVVYSDEDNTMRSQFRIRLQAGNLATYSRGILVGTSFKSPAPVPGPWCALQCGGELDLRSRSFQEPPIPAQPAVHSRSNPPDRMKDRSSWSWKMGRDRPKSYPFVLASPKRPRCSELGQRSFRQLDRRDFPPIAGLPDSTINVPFLQAPRIGETTSPATYARTVRALMYRARH